MEAKTHKVTADTLAKAQKKLKATIPDGYVIDTVTVIDDGEPRAVRDRDNTIEAAFARARKGIPVGAVIARETVVDEPKTETFQVEAFDEQSGTAEAQSRVQHRFDHSFQLKAVRLVKPGSKGILGIGKKPNVYEAEVFRPAFVEIIWRAEAEIAASLITAEGQIKKLIEDLGNSRITWELFPEPDDTYAVEVRNEGKPIRENAFRSLVSLGAMAIPQLCQALGDARKPRTPIDYPNYVFPRSASAFSQNGPETKDEEEVGRTIAKLLVKIGDRELVRQEMANLEGIARTRALWVLSRLGDSEADRLLRDLSQANDPEAMFYLHSKRK